MRIVLFLLVFPLLSTMVFAQHKTSKEISSAEIRFEFVSKKVKGTIEGFESQSIIDWENPEKSVFEGSVQSETLDTNNGLRNWSLRSGKYFDTDDYPKIYFKSSNVRLVEDKLLVEGNLTIKSISKKMTISFQRKGQQLIGTTSLYSLDYGIKIKKNRADNLVNIKMIFTLSD
ncbi:MAG: YceI family protein [Bacteroidota bacterium]|nr:YceI family protein [uncultured Allomuricauda sp.]